MISIDLLVNIETVTQLGSGPLSPGAWGVSLLNPTPPSVLAHLVYNESDIQCTYLQNRTITANVYRRQTNANRPVYTGNERRHPTGVTGNERPTVTINTNVFGR